MQAVVYFRASGAVADSHFIVGIDDVVAIHVAILYITGLHRREILCGTCSDVCFILEETDSFQSVELSVRISRLDKIRILAGFFQHFLDFVFVQREVTADIKFHLTELFAIIKTNFYTLTIHDTCIFIRRLHAENFRVFAFRSHPNVCTVFFPKVKSHIQTSEKFRIHTNIVFIGLFMARIGGSHPFKVRTSETRVPTAVERISTSRSAILLGIV